MCRRFEGQRKGVWGVSDPPPEREMWPHPRSGGSLCTIVGVAVVAMRRLDLGRTLDANQAQPSLDSVPGSRSTPGPAVNRRDDKVLSLALHRSWPTATAATTHRAARRHVRVEPDHHAVDDGLGLVPVKARRWAPTTPPAWLSALTGSSTEPRDGTYVIVPETTDRTPAHWSATTCASGCCRALAARERFVQDLAFMFEREAIAGRIPDVRK